MRRKERFERLRLASDEEYPALTVETRQALSRRVSGRCMGAHLLRNGASGPRSLSGGAFIL